MSSGDFPATNNDGAAQSSAPNKGAAPKSGQFQGGDFFHRFEVKEGAPRHVVPNLKPENFSPGTKFFARGGDMPIAVVSPFQAFSWYGGAPIEWNSDRLVFARQDSEEEFTEVSFAEFAKIMADSVASTVDRNKEFEEEIAPFLAKLSDDRSLALRRLAVDRDDFMYCAPDKYGIWRDPDGDPI